MAESDTSRYAAQEGGSGNAAVDVMAVLMRGWETARRNIESQDQGQGGEGEAAGLFCGFAYGSPGTFCPLFYYHAESVTKATDSSSPSGGD